MVKGMRIASVSVVLTRSGKKWVKTVHWYSTFSRGKDVDKFDSFEDAYRSAREYPKDKVQIAWHPPWMQKAINAVDSKLTAEQDDMAYEDKEKEKKERRLLKLLKKKYESKSKKS